MDQSGLASGLGEVTTRGASGEVRIEVHPVAAERWPDLTALFGPRGACGGCWCMTWRLSSAEYEARKGDRNRRALRRLVAREPSPGLLAYLGGRPVGWCAVAPREAYPKLDRSRVAARVDDRPVWSIVCFYVVRDCRGHGIASALLDSAVDFAVAHGAEVVEGYPVEPAKDEMPDLFAFTGLASMFRRAGFHEVARRSPTRPVMRRELPARRTGIRRASPPL